jgi:TolB-like protein/Tfp pilus assembly protein PilF
VTERSHAVFLSYASQDAGAAQRICKALRAAGIEVWFDKSELRGGDACDQSIRRQIRNCALLIPVISRHTHDRAEGYFRLEWKLAVDRSHLIMSNKAFLLPVVIDDTGDDDENVPDKFREVQWTRLPAGETPPAFVERLKRLLSGEVTPAQELARPTGGSGPHPAPTSHGVPQRNRVWVGAIAAAALVAVLGYLGVERLDRPKASDPSASSIAVLPLANESGDASQLYFSDGISEDLINALGQVPNLKVIGRSSAFRFRDSKESSRSIGEKLGVAHLLEGSVRRAGDMIRVSAELIDASDGSMQWSEHYDRPYKDLFALQDEITRAVTQALKTKLLPGERAVEQSERPPSGSLEAYNALLQAWFYERRDTEQGYRKAIESYEQATQLDPGYALAWSGLGGVWASLGGAFLEGAQQQEAYAKARDAIDRALALSPSLADAHVTRGIVLQDVDFDWHGAEAEFRRAAALAPNNASVKRNLGVLLASFGQVDQAIELTRQATALEPLRANYYNWIASYLLGVNRLDEAERAIHRAIELEPGAQRYHRKLTMIEVLRGNGPAALAAAQQEPPGSWQDIALALARQIGSDRSAADAALKTLIEKDSGDAPFQIAEVYAVRNDANKTFEWLDRAWTARDGGIESLLYDPFILRFKGDPRFAAFCRKVGLPVPGEKPASKST